MKQNNKISGTGVAFSPVFHVHQDGKLSLDSVSLTSKINQDKFNSQSLNDEYIVCVICGKEVSVDDAFSNRGENCHCRDCIENDLQEAGIDSVYKYCEKYVWSGKRRKLEELT